MPQLLTCSTTLLIDSTTARCPQAMILGPLLLLILGISSTVQAQTTGAGYDALTPSFAGVAKTMHATIRRNLAEAAQAMPPDEYSFRPTRDVRTFAQLIGHLIHANWFFCSQAKQDKPPTTTNHEQLTDKAALVKALNDSLVYCDDVYSSTTDASLNQPVLQGNPTKTVRRCRPDVQHHPQQRALRQRRRPVYA
jgi:hypothetical protein